MADDDRELAVPYDQNNGGYDVDDSASTLGWGLSPQIPRQEMESLRAELTNFLEQHPRLVAILNRMAGLNTVRDPATGYRYPTEQSSSSGRFTLTEHCDRWTGQEEHL